MLTKQLTKKKKTRGIKLIHFKMQSAKVRIFEITRVVFEIYSKL